MTYTSLAKEWLDIRDGESVEGMPRCEAVLAFAKYLDERDEPFGIYDESGKRDDCCDKCGDLDENGQHAHHVHCQPRKEDKPVYTDEHGILHHGDGALCDCVRTWCKEHGQWECEKSHCRMAREKPQPKPEPIEELSGGVVYADARDEVSKKIAEQMARKIIELQNKLNEVIRRLNTLTK